MATWLVPVSKVEPQPVEPVAEISRPKFNLALSENWQAEHTVALIEKHIQKHLNGVWFGAETAEKKKIELRALQQQIRRADVNELGEILTSAKTNSTYNAHRLFAHKGEKTATQAFIEELPQRVTLAG